MAVVLEQTKLIAVGTDDKTVPAFDANTASGNLVIGTRSGRFGSSGPVPSISAPSGYTGVVPSGETDPQIPDMEAHTTAVAYREGDGTTMSGSSFSWTGTASCTIGNHHEFSGISSPTLDKCAAAGSSTSNVSSIATGSTGTLGASSGLAFIVGLNRSGETTNSLSQDAGATEIFDRGVTGSSTAYNEMHAWEEFSASTAYNVTVSHSSGSSTRMGALVATFIAGGSSGQSISPTGPTVSVTAGTLTVVEDQPITPTGPTVSVTPGTLTVSAAAAEQAVTPTGPTVTATAGALALDLSVAPVGASVGVSAGTLTVTPGAVNLSPVGPTVAATPGTLTVSAGAVAVDPVAPTVTASAGTLTIAKTPAAAVDLAGIAGNGEVVLTWSAPDDGGSTITDYVVQYRVAVS